ncbi:MAG: hypothetical protein KBH82_12615, partial [Syntrophorhabdaceae bacterium]|nr:hypothetical protein [Syntrophorhabdaceae bacterium]
MWLIEDKFSGILRSVSAQIIKEVEKGFFLDETLDHYFKEYRLSDSQKSLIYEITSGVIRWKGFLDHIVSKLIKRGIKDDIRYVLWVSLYQISFMKKASYHVVNETVEYTKQEFG